MTAIGMSATPVNLQFLSVVWVLVTPEINWRGMLERGGPSSVLVCCPFVKRDRGVQVEQAHRPVKYMALDGLSVRHQCIGGAIQPHRSAATCSSDRSRCSSSCRRAPSTRSSGPSCWSRLSDRACSPGSSRSGSDPSASAPSCSTKPYASISNLACTQVSLILIAILAAVIVSERISAKVRHAII